MPETRRIPEIVVLASGRGSTFEAIALAVKDGRIKGRISMLICNRPEAPVMEIASRMSVPSSLVSGPDESMFAEISELLERHGPDLIVLAGFMKILPEEIVRKYGERMINTHPSLLPCFGGKGFYGDRVHRAVLKSGARISGCTVHFVTPDVDGGPIIAQESVPVEDGDDVASLRDRVHSRELELIVKAIARILTEPYRISGKRVLFGR